MEDTFFITSYLTTSQTYFTHPINLSPFTYHHPLFRLLLGLPIPSASAAVPSPPPFAGLVVSLEPKLSTIPLTSLSSLVESSTKRLSLPSGTPSKLKFIGSAKLSPLPKSIALPSGLEK